MHINNRRRCNDLIYLCGSTCSSFKPVENDVRGMLAAGEAMAQAAAAVLTCRACSRERDTLRKVVAQRIEEFEIRRSEVCLIC